MEKGEKKEAFVLNTVKGNAVLARYQQHQLYRERGGSLKLFMKMFMEDDDDIQLLL